MKREFYLVRHCQATGQESDAPLTKLGKQQAISLIDYLTNFNIKHIISSPFLRTLQSITPVAEYLDLQIKIDNRLTERVLSSTSLDNWQISLQETFQNLDLCFEGGESSRKAMKRGVAVISETLQQTVDPFAIVTHGNLMSLILKHFDSKIGYEEWKNLTNPDIYYVCLNNSDSHIERIAEWDNAYIAKG